MSDTETTETGTLVEHLQKMIADLTEHPNGHIVWGLYDGPTEIRPYAADGRVLVTVSKGLLLGLAPQLAMRLGIELIIAGNDVNRRSRPTPTKEDEHG